MESPLSSIQVGTGGQPAREDLQQALREIVAEAASVIDFQDCSIALYDPAQQELVTLASSNPKLDAPHARFKIGQGIAGLVAQTLEPALVGDVTENPQFLQLGPRHITSVLCVPVVRDRDRLLGTITAVSPKAHAFGHHQLRLLQLLASMAGLTVAQIVRARESRVLYEVGRSLLVSTGLSDTFDLLRTGLPVLLPLDLLMLQQATAGVESPLSWCSDRARVCGMELDLSSFAVRGARVLSAQEFREVSGVKAEDSGVQSYLFVPLQVASEAVGYLLVGCSQSGAYNQGHLESLETLAVQVALSLRGHTLFDAMNEQRERLESVFAYSSDAILMITNDLIVRANPAAIELLGLPEDQVLGMHREKVLELLPLPPETGGGPDLYELHTSGGTREVQVSVSDVHSDKAEHQILTLKDVTEQRELDRAKSNFIGIVSHELRTPLSAVLGFTDILITSTAGRLDPSEEEFLGHVRTSARHLVQLVNDILDLSRIDAGHFSLNIGPVVPDTLVRQVIGQLSALARESGVDLVAEIPQKPPATRGDGRRIEQVLINIVGNALKATPEGGRVVVSVEQQANDVLFKVSDTGPGLPREEHAKIFERFYQPVSAPRLATKGSGLGLAIAKYLVEEHGGRIWVESEVGQGATFLFTIPLPDPAQGRSPRSGQGQRDDAVSFR